MANTNATTSWNAKWFSMKLQETLKKALVCEKICQVDHSDGKYIWNPYGGSPTTTVQSLSGGSQGTYTPAAFISADDTLTVTDEFVVSEHIYGFEKVMQHGNIIQSRMDEMINSVATAIDKFVVNYLCDQGTGTYDTPTGGFSTSTNVNKAIADLSAKVMGYADSYKGLYLVLENSDMAGVILSQMGSGYSYADAALNNGLIGHIGGVDIYVVRDGTFVSATMGSLTVTNSGHRVFGVKGVTTYAMPSDITWEEKLIGSSTGTEYVAVAYVGFKAWYQKLALTVDITIK
jgi:hypothetical protein